MILTFTMPWDFILHVDYPAHKRNNFELLVNRGFQTLLFLETYTHFCFAHNNFEGSIMSTNSFLECRIGQDTIISGDALLAIGSWLYITVLGTGKVTEGVNTETMA